MLDFSAVSSVIFLPFLHLLSNFLRKRILYTAKKLRLALAFQLQLPCAAAAHYCSDDCRGRAAAAPFFPKLSYKLSFHKAEYAGPLAKEFRLNLLSFLQASNITMGLSNLYRSCGETFGVLLLCSTNRCAGWFFCLFWF